MSEIRKVFLIKKVLWLALVLTLALVMLAGCGGAPAEETPVDDTPGIATIKRSPSTGREVFDEANS